MGAWIEIDIDGNKLVVHGVAPFMGAWIEIKYPAGVYKVGTVAPFMGAWIEIHSCRRLLPAQSSRTLYGCVD